MGKYYVPDEHGNFQEYESEADYRQHESEKLNEFIQLLLSKAAYTVLTLVFAWWPWPVLEPLLPLWLSIILTILAIVNVFLPNSNSSPFMRFVRGILLIGSFIFVFMYITGDWRIILREIGDLF